MASVVVAVAIFLLGVSVGRGVKTATVNAGAPAATDVAQAGDTTVPATLPPPTTTTPADKAYHDQLQGQTPPPAQPQPDPAPATPPPAQTKPADPPTPVSEQPGAAPAAQTADAGRRSGAPTGTPPPTPTAPPAASTKPPTPPPDVAPKVGATGAWLVQVGAFGSRENADTMVAQLKAKGHKATVDTNGPARSRFRVTLGPFADRPTAEGTATRLKGEGFTPFVTR